MIKKRIFSVILAVLLVITCASEAMFIKFLQNDKNTMEKQIEDLQNELVDQKALLQSVNNKVESKTDDTMLRLYLPDDIYVCETRGAVVYNSSVVYGINLNSYICRWESEIGNSRTDCFEIPAMSPAGDYEVTLRIYDLDFNEFMSKSFRLHIVPDRLEDLEVSRLNPFIYATPQDEVPDFLTEYLEAATDEDNPNVIIIFPSIYEDFDAPDGIQGRVSQLVAEIRAQYPNTQIIFVEPSYPGRDLEMAFAGDDTVWAIPNILMPDQDAVYAMLCRLISEREDITEVPEDEAAGAEETDSTETDTAETDDAGTDTAEADAGISNESVELNGQ